MTDKNDSDDWPHDDDALIERLVPNPNAPDVTPISGVFIGRGSAPDTVRLYTTVQLNQYFQIPRDKVLGTKRFPSGVVVVWVPADLRVQLLRTDTMAAEFLRGNIQAGAGALSAVASGFRRLLASAPTGGGGEISRSPFCQTDVADPGNPICTLDCPMAPPTGCRC